MCGLGFSIISEAVGRPCKSLTDRIEHRGPDFNGAIKVYHTLNETGKRLSLSFSHRRLAITDFSSLANQPLIVDDQFIIIFNGAIFNYKELRDILQSIGAEFVTDSDTEVIIQGYKFYGLDVFKKLQGMWSIVIWDKRCSSVYFSRDPFGIKPLFYYQNNDEFYCFSEVKQLLDIVNLSVNHDTLTYFLNYGVTNFGDETLFNGVFEIEPGFVYEFDLITEKLEKRESVICGENLVGLEYSKSLNNNLASAFNADVPYSVSVSGGLDSSILAYLGTQASNKPYNNTVYTSVSSDSSNSEEIWAEQITNELGLSLVKVKTDFFDLKNHLPQIIYHLETPTQSMSAYFNYFVYQSMKKDGVKMSFCGQGADELFGGYSQFQYARFFNFLPKFIGNPLSRIFDVLLSFFWRHTHHPILKYKSHKRIEHFFKKVKKPFFNLNDVIDYFLLKDPLPRYLHWEDRLSMAHSIESRVPFLQQSIYLLAKDLPWRLRYKQGFTKYILRKTYKDKISDKILFRKDKKGFANSEQFWILTKYSADFRVLLLENLEYLSDYIHIESAIKGYDQMVVNQHYDPIYWRIIQLGLWHRTFINKLVS